VPPRHAGSVEVWSHVVLGDGVELTWPRKEPGIERLRALAARLAV